MKAHGMSGGGAEGGAGDRIRIDELSRISGLPASTIKYYVRIGLLPAPLKARYNLNLYDRDVPKRLAIISSMRSEGLSLGGIKDILDRYSFEAVSEWEEFRNGTSGGSGPAGEGIGPGIALTREDRRAREIAAAAANLFSRKGYNRVSMDDVAVEAGVSKGTCYRYFSSKEELFVACVLKSVSDMLELLEESSREAEGVLPRMGIKGMSFVKHYREVYFLLNDINSEAANGNRMMAEKALECYRDVSRFLAEDIKEGVREGTLREVDAASVAYALISIIEFAGRMHLIDSGFDALEFLVKLIDFILHGIAAG